MCGNNWLLTIAYAKSLQYWVEKQSPLRSQNLHPFGRKCHRIMGGSERICHLTTETLYEVLGATHKESSRHEPHATIFSHVLLSPNEEQVRRATTYTASPVAKRDMAKCIASPARTERENPCLLFITASVAWLNLGPGCNTAGRPTTEGNTFQNPWMAATFSVPARVVCYGDATIKELDG